VQRDLHEIRDEDGKPTRNGSVEAIAVEDQGDVQGFTHVLVQHERAVFALGEDFVAELRQRVFGGGASAHG